MIHALEKGKIHNDRNPVRIVVCTFKTEQNQYQRDGVEESQKAGE
jgi:hypothetical protein